MKTALTSHEYPKGELLRGVKIVRKAVSCIRGTSANKFEAKNEFFLHTAIPRQRAECRLATITPGR
jgi:hypothetical protein